MGGENLVPVSHRLRNIDALRGCAALCVVMFHFLMTVPSASFGSVGQRGVDVLVEDVDLGRIGVVLFFAISGFIIPNSLVATARHPVRRFLISRFFRLYPLYWASLLACVALMSPRPGAYVAFANLTMIQGFLLAPDINGASWTLAIELVFYGLCLMLFLGGVLSRRSVQFWSLVAALLLALLLAVMRYQLMRKLPVALPLGLSAMFFGTLWRGARFDRDRDAARYVLWAVLCQAVVIPVVCVLAYSFDTGLHERPSPYIVSSVVGLGIFLAGTAWIHRCPAWIAHLGVISYSTYLLHTPVMWLAQVVGLAPTAEAGAWWNWASVVWTTAAVVAVSHVSYIFIERPAVRLGRRLEALDAARGPWPVIPVPIPPAAG